MVKQLWLNGIENLRPVKDSKIPLYRQDFETHTLLYTPGMVAVVAVRDIARFVATLGPCANTPGHNLWQRATTVLDSWKTRTHIPFAPECLTIYLNNACNLQCMYCYTAPSQDHSRFLTIEAIDATAKALISTYRATNQPFYVVFHGGGEPTLYHHHLEAAYATLEKIALEYAVPVFWYLATNGVMSEEQARWIARHFDLVGLSCDGPAAIHDRQRPQQDGTPSLFIVERTAHILRAEQTRFHVRSTITPESLAHQEIIADYICRQLQPAEIHFEPVYAGGRATNAIILHKWHAFEFLKHFLQARVVAQAYGIPLLTSGSRPGEIHGPYCNISRAVVTLTPGGIATPCFKLTSAAQVLKANAAIGSVHSETGQFSLDLTRIEQLCRRLSDVPVACSECFNAYHCTYGCPDICLLALDIPTQTADFRCLVYKTLTYTTLRQTAEQLWDAVQARQNWKDGEMRYAIANL